MKDTRYLTVQDVIWVNAVAMKSPQRFDYAKLEESVNYQYGSGQSTDVPLQAAKFLSGFTRKAPFSEGNEVAAFVSFVAFLYLNGKRLKLSDAEAASLAEKAASASPETIIGAIEDDPAGVLDGAQEAVRRVFADYPDSISGLCTGAPQPNRTVR